jgi:hypothetical protein
MPSLNNRVRLTYGHRNPLNHLNYREMRELASNERKYSGSWQNNVKRGSEVPTNNVESCEDNQPSLRGAVHSITGKTTLLRGQFTALRGVTLFSFQIPIWLFALQAFELTPRRCVSFSLYAGVNLFNQVIRKADTYTRRFIVFITCSHCGQPLNYLW